MRQRREKQEELSKSMAAADEKMEDDEGESNGFFACYLLASACPRYKGHTYIGFTVNPKRRIRQHNGEIRCGAWRTKRKRPWEMVLCIYGFPTNVSALQFEWAWQHPNESLAVRSAAATFKSLSGVANKVKLAYTMLTLPAWCSLNITVNYFSTKYMNNAAGCPSLPEHMKVQVSPMDDLPCYSEGEQGVAEHEDDWEYNREYEEEACSFRVYGSTKEVPQEISQKLTDYQTGRDGIPIPHEFQGFDRELPIPHEFHGFGKELEDQEREPPSSCTSSYPDMGTSHNLHGCDKELKDDERERPSRALSYTVAGRSETGIIIEDGDNDRCEGNGLNLQQRPGRKNLKSKVGRRNNWYPPSEYEVIDVSTPSPDCRTSSNNRFKRRVTCVGSEVIDLTKSPTFIQL